MATQEELLNQAELQNKLVLNKQPIRAYGAGYFNKQLFAQQAQASKNLQDIQEQKQKIEQLKAAKRKADLYNAGYNQGANDAFTGRTLSGDYPAEFRAGYIAGREAYTGAAAAGVHVQRIITPKTSSDFTFDTSGNVIGTTIQPESVIPFQENKFQLTSSSGGTVYIPGVGGYSVRPGGKIPTGAITGQLGTALAGADIKESISPNIPFGNIPTVITGATSVPLTSPINQQMQIPNLNLQVVQNKDLMIKQTIQDYNIKKLPNEEMFLRPTLYERQTGTYTDKKTGRIIPITEIRYNAGAIETGTGEQLDRPATTEEIKQFRQNREVSASTTSPSKLSRTIGEIGGIAEQRLYEANIGGKDLLSSVGISNELINQQISSSPLFQLTGLISKAGVPYVGETGRFIQASIEAPIQDIYERPFTNVAIYGAGVGLGFGFKAGATAAGMIPKVGGYASSGFKATALGYGGFETGKAVLLTASQMAYAQSPEEAGSAFGKTIKDFALLGYGFKTGEKGFNILKGKIATRGLKELEVPQGVYPQAPIKEQLALFQKNIYPEISKKPVAFHTTPSIFYKSGEIKLSDIKSTSELKVLYASTQVSTAFAKIPGSGAETPKGLKAFYNSLKETIAPEKSPGVAALEPKGFKSAKIGFSSVKQFEGQKYVKNRGYAYFKEPPVPGQMEVLNIKSEIESGARPEAGSYKATGKKFYTEINGVKVPIDAFKYAENNIKIELKNSASKIDKGINIKSQKGFVPQEYSIASLRPSQAYISSLGILSSNIKSSLANLSSSINKSLSSSNSSINSSINSSRSLSSNNSSASSANRISSSVYSESSLKSYSPLLSSNKVGSSSKTSYTGFSSIDKSVISPIRYSTKITNETKKKSLGTGYYVYGKQLKTGKLFRINNTPVTKSRAEDIGAYFVSETLARTFVVKKANKPAEEDYQFAYIPEGYFKQKSQTLRSYRIKKGKQTAFSDERFIQKAVYALSGAGEKAQIKEFRKFQEENKNIYK
jgi:hypothetical protein